MKKTKRRLYMKLDGFKKISGQAPDKARTMDVLSKIAIMYRSGRLIVSLLIGIYFIFLVFDNIGKNNFNPKSWLSTALSSGMLIGVGLCLVIAIFLIQWGMRRMFKTISIIEYGAFASATVKNITKRKVATWYSMRFFPVTRWIASCWFKDSANKNSSFDVIIPEEFLKKGDQIKIVYDPGMPENAIAIDALPFFVKTDPALSS